MGVTIENPILNSPFNEPTRHFRFDKQGITNDIIESRRVSSYFMPIARPRKKGKQAHFETEWTRDRIQENKRVNRVRQRVAQWRAGGHVGVTATTGRLLEYWTNPERERKLFFCQIRPRRPAALLFVAEEGSFPGTTASRSRLDYAPNDEERSEPEALARTWISVSACFAMAASISSRAIPSWISGVVGN